jgi:hypothetical protein
MPRSRRSILSLAFLGLLPCLALADDANLFDLRGGGIHVNYAASGIDGNPHFSFQQGKTKLSFTGDEIRVAETELGIWVSVNIATTVDSGATTFSLLLPRINIDSSPVPLAIPDNGPATPVATLGIITHHKFSPIPQFNVGQLDLYQAIKLKGEAQAVVF